MENVKYVYYKYLFTYDDCLYFKSKRQPPKGFDNHSKNVKYTI